jgi:hypothetical protein
MESKPVIRHNQIKNGIEILFDGRPEPEVIGWLKSKGYYWSRFNKVWYRKFSEAAWKEAFEHFELPEGDPGDFPKE